MTLDELANIIEDLKERVMFGRDDDVQELETAGMSERTQLDIVACLDHLSLAHISARKAHLRHTRELTKRGAQ